MSIEKIRLAFVQATSAKKYRAALRLAQRLRGRDQMVILDALFTAADRLKVQRSTGEPLGMEQRLDGSVMVTWETQTRHPSGCITRTAHSAALEPAKHGPGWVTKGAEVPEGIVEAVTAAAMADQLRAPKKKRRIYVR